MSDRSDVVRAASRLRSSDTVAVHVIYAGGIDRITKFNWKVELTCSRPAWKHPGVCGGRSARFFIGYCRTRESAERRAQRIIRLLEAARMTLAQLDC